VGETFAFSGENLFNILIASDLPVLQEHLVSIHKQCIEYFTLCDICSMFDPIKKTFQYNGM